jgi:hypothetical protein
MTRIQKINLALILVVLFIMGFNLTLQVTIIRQQRQTIDLAELAIHNWQVRALACESGGQTVVLK